MSKLRMAASGGTLAAALAALGVAAVFTAPQATAQDRDTIGEAAYYSFCGYCHEAGEETGAPSTESIRQLSKANIRYTLELGYMREYAKDVPADELEAMINWLPLNEGANNSWVEAAACTGDRREVRLDGAPRTATTFGLDVHNNRALSAEQAGLSTGDMEGLELAWAVAFPQNATMRSQPVIIGDTLFIAATDSGYIYALDSETGCVKWTYESDLTLRSSLSFAEAADGAPEQIIAGDAGGRVHGIDARTGEERWVTDIKLTDVNRITGAPVVYQNRIYAPLSAIEVNYAGNDEYGCCIGQGAVVALDVATGEQLWVGRTMEPAEPTIVGRTGTQQWGPSGAIIWSTPIVDAERGLIYAGTGENTSWPATDTSDAIIAYDMQTGERRWVFQATAADIWNYACGRRGPNCDWPGEYQSPDHDFGATPMLVTAPNGRDMIIAGQKSGVVWALNPDDGELLWSNKIGRGSAGGGMRWGLTYDGERVFAPTNDPSPRAGDPDTWGPALHALNVVTGEVEWTYKPNGRDCDPDMPVAEAFIPNDRLLHIDAPVLPPARGTAPEAPRPRPRPVAAEGAEGADPAPVRTRMRCRVGMAAAPMLVDGAVVTGTNGGMLRIFEGETGRVLFEYDTNREYETVNGVEGHGGSLDSAPYVAANGTLFVQSGYARFGQPPGNVLLAFRPKD